MRLILDRTAQELDAGALQGAQVPAGAPKQPSALPLGERALHALAWMRRLADRSRSARREAGGEFTQRLVSMFTAPAGIEEPVCQCPWTQLLGMPSVPEDRGKRLLLVGFAARMGRDDVLRQVLRTEPDPSVRAAAQAILETREHK